ncbi:MAG: 23S rRNA (uracil-5-)-methyltransferase RumA, partial [Candidatus Nephrothrix sp. EaCA]
MKKGDIIEHLRVETMAAEGKSIAHYNGAVVFLKGAAPGDVASAALTKI